ncbi:MAG: flavodoxin domain-containing protein [Desulfobacteraceae bacterium]|nr:flavodoxin domain-containing protein [Desulfobacteraceae bacterium]
MKPIEIAKGVWDVGVIDWNIRDFHGYSTYRGSTYNAFLIIDEKIALIDTVKAHFADQLLDHIAQIVDPKKIDLVISNHTEMDHTGALPRVMHRIGENKPLYCSKMGRKNIARHFLQSWNFHEVASGSELSLGRRTLSFLETRMLHWPDSMFTLLKEDNILFSSDAFGKHLASPAQFDDQADDGALWLQAKKYFANILLPYAPKILKLIEDVEAMGLAPRMICPDHGILWRKDPAAIVKAYRDWALQKPVKRAIVVYDTMWHSTETMAEAVGNGLAAEGIPAQLIHIRSSHRSDIITEAMDAGAMVFGSPTLNNQMFPTVADVLTYMKGLRPKNKIAAAFGSYGWSGEAVKMVHQELAAMGCEMAGTDVRLPYVPDAEGRKACFELGRSVGQALKARLENA